MVNMLSSCLKSIAENTHLAMTTKQQTELQKAELANVKATMGEMQEKMEGIMHENATLRAQATGGTPPPDPGVAALKQRLLEMKVFHAPQGTPAVTIEWFRRILARAELPPDVQVRTPPSLRR